MTRYRYMRYLFLTLLACICSASAMPVEEQPESEPVTDHAFAK